MPTFSARELITADRWSRLFFTTYALSLSFFEAVVLDAIVRGQIDSSLILADVAGVRSAMNELGAQGVGRSYDVEPVSVRGGCFHPKLLSVTSKTDAHLVIGSGNLTFGGWGSNLECVEHLHPSFAPDAFADTAVFLRSIATSARIKHAALEPSLELADDLESRIRNQTKTGAIRVIHNVGQSILEQIAIFADDLGGAIQLVAASPFFDGSGIERLCDRLSLPHAYVHVHHGGTVLGTAGTNWPSAGAEMKTKPVSISFLEENGSRPLHAKLFEVSCRRGRVVISGSSNATIAGLEADRNVELCVARIQRETFSGWRFTPSLAPDRSIEEATDDQEDTDNAIAVLRATLRQGVLRGRVISSFPNGTAELFRRTILHWSQLGEVEVSDDGDFEFHSGDAWEYSGTGQFLIRLENRFGESAQGFVALPEMREIARRLGAHSQNFFSLLQSKETAADVAAIMDFIRLHPEWLPSREIHGGGGTSGERPQDDPLVDIRVLTAQGGLRNGAPVAGSTSWSTEARFMQDVFSAFQKRRGPIDSTATNREADDADDADPADPAEASEAAARDSARALQSFDRLLDQMIDCDEEDRQSMRALQIAEYVCERLEVEPFQVQIYMDRLLGSFTRQTVADAVRDAVLALALLWANQLGGDLPQRAKRLRRQVLRLYDEFPEEEPAINSAGGFASRPVSAVDASVLWKQAYSVCTIQEEMRSFWTTDGNELSVAAFPQLSRLPEWAFLRHGPGPRMVRLRSYSGYCPHCFLALSGVEATRLRDVGVATCSRGRILLCEAY